MKNIVSSLKKSAKNFDKIVLLAKRLISSTLLSKCGFRKERGLSCKIILIELLMLTLENKSLYQKAGKDKEMSGNLKTYYRFLENAKYQWEKLLYEVAEKVVLELSRLTDHSRQALAIDDSLYERPWGKKIELCAWQFDHVFNVCKRGFRFLTVGWADGFSFVPLMFRLVSSRKTETVPEGYDKRTLAYKRRVNALKRMTDSVIEFLEKAKSLGAQYVICDSWFGTPKAIGQIRSLGYDVISHIKTNYLYCFNNGLYKSKYIQKHLDKSKEWCDISGAQNINPNIVVLGSAKVTFKKGNEPIRLLFCKLKGSKNPDEVAIIACTDISNNQAENAIRPFVIGRKNWLFCDTVGGAFASSVVYSLVETAKANNLDPYRYLLLLLTELPQIDGPLSADILEPLLPWNAASACANLKILN